MRTPLLILREHVSKKEALPGFGSGFLCLALVALCNILSELSPEHIIAYRVIPEHLSAKDYPYEGRCASPLKGVHYQHIRVKILTDRSSALWRRNSCRQGHPFQSGYSRYKQSFDS